MDIKEFPAEFFIKLEVQDFLLGRLCIHKMAQSYWSEIDIVQKESKKIWAHVGDIYGITEFDEIIDMSVQSLSDYLHKSKTT